ncbi:hypothetical protein J4401_01905 [Candidatus Woesearchaeota archaeon]|nr:hypothetical protein [Candidatus Woesearchaeota archaeon]
MFDILVSPLEAIASAKEEKNIGKTFFVLFIASLIGSLNIFVSRMAFDGTTLVIALAVLAGSFLLTLLIALLFQLSLYVLSQKGGYFEALTSLSYGSLIAVVGFLVYSIVGLIPSQGTILTIIVAVLTSLVAVFTLVLSNAVALRAAVELFQTDFFTVVIALVIVYIALVVAAYLAVIKILVLLVPLMMPSLGGAVMPPGFV